MILGAIAGDIIGSIYEHHNVKSKQFQLIMKSSHFTDDTVMTLAVASALRKFKKGSNIPEAEFENALIDAMKYFGKKYPHAGYGSRFKHWIYSSSRESYNSYGNGSAMRVSPVAWYFEELETVEKFAEISARVTHSHPEGIKGAQAVASAVFLARKGKSKSEIKKYIEGKYKYNLDRTCDEIRPNYEFDVTCQGSVPEAITAFLEGENFEDAVRNAVSLGGDSDTIAAITGSIAEGFWGVPDKIKIIVSSCLNEFIISELEKFDNALNNEEEKQIEKNKNGITEIVFILDRSSSMGGLEDDTIGGFNSAIKKQKDTQKQTQKDVYVSTVLFDHETMVLHDRVNLAQIHEMTKQDYWVRGSTALLDAVGGSIHHIAKVHKNTHHDLVPENTIFVIITDGYENASTRYSYEKVKEMIEHEKEKYGWEFLFLGANIDAVQAASHMGISADRAVDYLADERGTELAYSSVSNAVECMQCSRPIRDSWREELDRDFLTRMTRSPQKRKNETFDDVPF